MRMTYFLHFNQQRSNREIADLLCIGAATVSRRSLIFASQGALGASWRLCAKANCRRCCGLILLLFS